MLSMPTRQSSPRPATLTIERLETFGRIVRPTNLTRLEAIDEHHPDSIRDLVRLVDRHTPEVAANVNELSDYGLIEVEEDGRAKRPTIWYDEIEFSGDVPLHGLEGGDNASVAPKRLTYLCHSK